MFDFQTKFKRQIEILGLCLSDQVQRPMRTFDLAAIFNVEELTIKRDLLDLRSYGIDIHSHKKAGVTLDNNLDKEKISDLILHYAGLNHGNSSMDKSTALLTEKLGAAALANLVLLQRCIDNLESARIVYNKSGDRIERDKLIEPLFIFQSEGCWRVVAKSDDKVKQYLFDKILSVKPTGCRFTKPEYNFADLVKYSWKSWFGTDRYFIKLWMASYWAETVIPRMLAADQAIQKNDDGSIIFQCTVNSLNEIAAWVVSRGEGVKVIEPIELKNIVIELAKGTLSNYR